MAVTHLSVQLVCSLILFFSQMPADGDLFPGGLQQSSHNYFIKHAKIYLHEGNWLTSKSYLLISGSPGFISHDKPQIYYISPTKIYAGTTIDVAVAGQYFTNFPASPSVFVGHFRVSEVTVESSTLLTFRFPSNISQGVYDVSIVYPGSYSLVVTQAINVVNPPPSIKSVFPNTLKAGDEAVVRVSGDNFQPGLTATVSGRVVEVDYQSKHNFSFKVPENVSPGYHILTVYNPDGEYSTFYNAIYVVQEESDALKAGCGCTEASVDQTTGVFLPYILAVLIIWRLSAKRE